MAENKIAADQIGVDPDDSRESQFSIVSNSGMDLKMMAEKIDKLEKELENNQSETRTDLDEFKKYFNEKLMDINLAIEKQKNAANLPVINSILMGDMRSELWKLSRENWELREQMREMVGKERKFKEQIADLTEHRNVNEKEGNGELAKLIGEKPIDNWSNWNWELNCKIEKEKIATELAAKTTNVKIGKWGEQNSSEESSSPVGIANLEKKEAVDLMKKQNGSWKWREMNGEKAADMRSDCNEEFYNSRKNEEENVGKSNATNSGIVLDNLENSTKMMAKQESWQLSWPQWEKIDDPDFVVEYKLILEILRAEDEFGNFILFVNEQVLKFVEMLFPYINDIKFGFYIYNISKWQEDEARVSIIYRLLKLLAPKIFALSSINHTDFNDFNRLFPGILDQIQYLAWRIDPSNIALILDWLERPRKDGKQKLIYSGQSMWSDLEPIMVERLKNKFANSMEAVNYLILLRSYWDSEFKMENKKTGEELNLYKKVLRNGNIVHFLARYPKGEHWWREMGEEKICQTKTEQSPEICINLDLMAFDEEENFSLAELLVEQDSNLQEINPDITNRRKMSKKMRESIKKWIDVKVAIAEIMQLDKIEECFDANYLADLKENKWNTQYGLPTVEMTPNSLGALYSGPRLNAGNKWTTVMAEIPFNRQNFIHFQRKYLAGYYEVRILNIDRWISLGFCDQKFCLLNCRVGDFINSIGLHENGRISVDGNKNWMQSKKCTYIIGDVIGCGLVYAPFNIKRKNSDSQILYFTTLNGNLLDFVFLPEKFVHVRLFPAVSLAHPGDSIKANFGAQKWLYDPIQVLRGLKLE